MNEEAVEGLTYAPSGEPGLHADHIARRRKRASIILTVAFLLTAVMIAILGWNNLESYQAIKSIAARDLRLVELRGLIVFYDEVLTMSAHMAVETGEAEWRERYGIFERKLGHALDEINERASLPSLQAAVRQTSEANDRLVALEMQAFDLSKAGETVGARALLKSEEYSVEKKRYSAGIDTVASAFRDRAAFVLARERHKFYVTAITLLVSVPVLLLVWLVALRFAYRWQKALVDANDKLSRQTDELVSFNEKLDREVARKTAELSAQKASALHTMHEAVNAKEEVEKAERLFRLAIDSSPYGIVVCNKQKHIVLLNSTAEKLTRWTDVDLTGLPFETLIPRRWYEKYYDTWARVFSQQEGESLNENVEITGLRKDGSEFPAEINMTSFFTRKEAFILITITDITEQRATERLLASQKRELERSNKELEQFAYAASHDLQEPLRKIKAFGERLEKQAQGALDDKSKDYLMRITNAASRMERLIDSLLRYSRVMSKGKPLTAVSLSEVLKGVLSDLEALIERTHATVDVGPLPVIAADALQMQQLFQNLIANALKFQKAGQKPHVLISSNGEDGGVVAVSVKDNGTGFDQKYVDTIFKPFKRLHSREQYEGTGIGLALCARIVARHSGSITAVSKDGEGATFVVRLPSDSKPREESLCAP